MNPKGKQLKRILETGEEEERREREDGAKADDEDSVNRVERIVDRAIPAGCNSHNGRSEELRD